MDDTTRTRRGGLRRSIPPAIRFRAGVRREGAASACITSPSTATAAPTSRRASGPALLLVHGIGDSSDTWRPVVEQLAEHHTVIAPDLLGHGRSEKPRADYTVAGFANGMRDLLSVLEVDRVTVVGHSLGGGVAAQFAYQFPERCERLVLVGSGGIGRTVSPLLRLAAVPGARGAHAAARPAAGPAGQSPRRRASCALLRYGARARRRGDPGRVRRAARHRSPPRHPADAALGCRLARPGHHHARPGLPGRGRAHAHHLGPARRHHPARARPAGPRSHARKSSSRSSTRPVISRITPTRPLRCCPARVRRWDGAGVASTARTGAAAPACCAAPSDPRRLPEPTEATEAEAGESRAS